MRVKVSYRELKSEAFDAGKSCMRFLLQKTF